MRRHPADEGFSIIEVAIAIALLALALILSIQPVMAALAQITDARRLSAAEHLAQAEIEAIRALPYGDTGHAGYTPSGVLPTTRDVVVEGVEYHLEIFVSYAGSATGLAIIDQGGDGVPGAFDTGVDYKVVEVVVTWAGQQEPLVVQTIIAPPAIGTHEGVANGRVTLAAHEPFASGNLLLPELNVQASPAAPIRSRSRAAEQDFPGVAPGAYVVGMAVADGWVFHPVDVANGLTQMVLTAGNLTETNLRVYRPARLVATITDAVTGLPVSGAVITLTHNPTGQIVAYPAGQYTIEGLIPDAYDIAVTLWGYATYSALSVNIPASYPNPEHRLSVALNPVPIEQKVVTFTVKDNTGRVVNGATVSVPLPEGGAESGTTNANGQVSLTLAAGRSYAATGSTPWGHGAATVSFNPSSTTSVTLNLSRPSGKGTMVLQSGARAQFRYRQGTAAWTYMPPNVNGEASFVAAPGYWSVAKVCNVGGSVLGATTVTIYSGVNSTATIYGTCP